MYESSSHTRLVYSAAGNQYYHPFPGWVASPSQGLPLVFYLTVQRYRPIHWERKCGEKFISIERGKIEMIKLETSTFRSYFWGSSSLEVVRCSQVTPVLQCVYRWLALCLRSALWTSSAGSWRRRMIIRNNNSLKELFCSLEGHRQAEKNNCVHFWCW